MKNFALFKKDAPMYRGKDRQTLPLFSELFPFGGKLDPENRWLKTAKLIPWEEIESKHMRYFSEIGRPASDCRLVIGTLLLKHMTGFSDDDIKKFVNENPYMQAFCGLNQFATEYLLQYLRRNVKQMQSLVDEAVHPEDR